MRGQKAYLHACAQCGALREGEEGEHKLAVGQREVAGQLRRHGEAIRGTRSHREAISGNQWPPAAIRSHQRQSEAISGKQRPSAASRGHQRQAEAISGNQRRSAAIRGDQ